MGKYLAIGAAFFLGMVMLKDGTLLSVAQDAFKGGENIVKGIKPITQVG